MEYCRTILGSIGLRYSIKTKNNTRIIEGYPIKLNELVVQFAPTIVWLRGDLPTPADVANPLNGDPPSLRDGGR